MPERSQLLLPICAISIGIVAALLGAEVLVRLCIPVRAVGPSLTVHDPVFGKRLKANFIAERRSPEFTTRITTNSLGFRGPEPVGPINGAVLFLGDSFTLGYCVSDGDEFPALVAARLRSSRGPLAPPVINAGIGDVGNGFWLKFLRARAIAMAPRVVVLQVTENDFVDNLRERLYELDGGRLVELPVPGPDPSRRLQGLIEAVPGLSGSHLVGLLRQAIRPERDAARGDGSWNPERPGPQGPLTLRIIDAAIAYCEAQGWGVIVVTADVAAARAKAIGEVVDRHAASMVVLPTASVRPDLYYSVDGHWRAAGHDFAANSILDVLRPRLAGAAQ